MIENVSGSLVMGLLAAYFAYKGGASQHWRLFLTTGTLGGYTTFSAYSLDVALLYQRGELALAQLDSLKKAGITDARIEEHPLNSARYAYRLQGLVADDKPELKAMLPDFPGAEIRACTTP